MRRGGGRAWTLTGLTVALGLALGLAAGVGGFTFVYARGGSYLTDDPRACANCHVMNEQFDGWVKSSHRAVAVCNDCHTPPGLGPKYLTKARNGFFHSYYFTTGDFPEPIQITPRNRAVAEQACRKCHLEIVAAIETHPDAPPLVSCLRCHRDVGHAH
jgi:cytochrome c nitrite reductase small subunit